ncbi:MAG TPA: murein L,D-transpeptidase catalytic domain family protein [Flavitalea sp.]|nr:murein L,D-transpeptidase catalytic domain family protein [Flavitalea sp.]
MPLHRCVRAAFLPALIATSFCLMSAGVKENDHAPKKRPSSSVRNVKNTSSMAAIQEARRLYSAGDFKKYGLSQKAFEYAWRGYQYLLKKGKVQRTDVISICDFSQSSRNKRLYVIDLNEAKVLINTYVAHGRNSGGEYARSFSNSPESHKSSLGFYITRTTYYGDHGISLKIDGVEKGINDRASSRHIVIHGSDYLGDLFMQNNPFNGRSFGCPAVPADEIEELVDTIKDGSCLFIYHPSTGYFKKSRLLG